MGRGYSNLGIAMPQNIHRDRDHDRDYRRLHKLQLRLGVSAFEAGHVHAGIHSC
jgi:hypothetical protein